MPTFVVANCAKRGLCWRCGVFVVASVALAALIAVLVLYEPGNLQPETLPPRPMWETAEWVVGVSGDRRFSFEDMEGVASLGSVRREVAAMDVEVPRHVRGGVECHDINEHDEGKCMREIVRAKKDFSRHRHRYPGLKRFSCLKAWHIHMHRASRGNCPTPCFFPCGETSVPTMWKPRVPDRRVEVKVLSYNLYWWHLFGKKKGIHNGIKHSAGKLIVAAMKPPFDVIGFQECEDFEKVMGPVGLSGEYQSYLSNHSTCIAYRKAAWTLLGHGDGDVAEDQPTEYYGTRGTQWIRLAHRHSDATLLFLNHHGPLAVNSGGQCGGATTAHKLMKLIADEGRVGDIVILVGDFNANAASLTIQELWKHLVLLYNGDSFGGVDNIFSNLGKSSLVRNESLGSGGSDHDAITVTMAAGGSPSIASVEVEHQASVEPAKAVRDSLESECGLMESNVQYKFSGANVWSEVVEIDSCTPLDCCSSCHTHELCLAWSWDERATSSSGPSCTLLGGDWLSKVFKSGVVSGLPTLVASKEAVKAAAQAIANV
eukprot:TRINITY_DN71601_c0_g1_i1.p1 TRINITY_DN71601_c0_g1~~TRINITY_DN71601_c0_g1_i1.p1  ORF type:complete len:595 (-),score=91.53 TRINITY_DN71601_c0_g1_i1:63-1688(-)